MDRWTVCARARVCMYIWHSTAWATDSTVK